MHGLCGFSAVSGFPHDEQRRADDAVVVVVEEVVVVVFVSLSCSSRFFKHLMACVFPCAADCVHNVRAISLD